MESGFSIVIPAHNEGAVIERTLRSILANSIDRRVQIIVVANGCSDDTAERARQFDGVEVIETAVGNKAAALNIGDQAAQFFPRAYVDADVEVSENLLQRVADAFSDPGVRIVSPGVQYICPGWNPALAGYYRLWQSLPYVRKDLTGRGVCAIDAGLRRRFAEFPELTADDRFLQNLTRPGERRIVEECFTRVRMAGTFRELLAVKTRWTYGNMELAQRRPELIQNDREGHRGALRHLIRRPGLWVHVPTFVFVYGYARLAAKKRLRERRAGWDRAESNRRMQQVGG
ncbi:MAG: glycosyltransferase [Bacillota bacterium]